MRFSWNEIRSRAAQFSADWKDAHYEKGETHTFYNEFFEIFGVSRRRVASFEEPVRRLDSSYGFIDLFWKGILLVEQKSAGKSLIRAKTQAFEYFPGLKETELPRYLLVSDFQTFELYDLDEEGEPVRFGLQELPQRIDHFGFILGIQRRTFQDQDPVNIEASELMGKMHDALCASGYAGHDLERLLVRLIFCLFADDTGIFEPRGIFHDLILQRTSEDGSDVGLWLNHLFQVINSPVEKRQKTLDEDLAQFPYVNGELFSEALPIPSFDGAMRRTLLEACAFSWDAISPAIFGSLFQSVMNPVERRSQGAHYTTERNILKVIEPLFLDELREELERIKARQGNPKNQALKAFQEKLSNLRFLDPACGCGNFLIIAYRELRALELEVLKELNPEGQRTLLDVATLSKVDVHQFYGIEINEFPVRIAEVALWMMDHIMNIRLSMEFGHAYARIPLRKSPHIHHADALEIEWENILPTAECSFVLGNPPFGGAKYQTPFQRAQVRRIAQLGGSGGTLDYVTAWLLKAAAYVQGGKSRIGFVATNSITQGEQVAQLWPPLLERFGMEIAFAHRTFAWGSDARGKAHVHVVIIGLTRKDQQPSGKRLFSYDDATGHPIESHHEALSPYLFDASRLGNKHLVVAERSRPLGHVPELRIGSKPIDGGRYIFTTSEKEDFLTQEPRAKAFIRPFVGSEEYINGSQRWILALEAVPVQQVRSMPSVLERVNAVKKLRLESSSESTRQLAETPARFHVTVIPERPFLVIPETSSERRDYVPIGWLHPPTIPSSLVRVLLDADLWHFGVLTSRMHIAWLAHIGGRLKSDFRYSIGVVYNTFPWPEATKSQKEKIRGLAQAVLDARATFPGNSLADLYDPLVMPYPLRQAHRKLDKAIDKLYRSIPFSNDRERAEYLFGLYESLIAPLTFLTNQKGKRHKKEV